MFNVYVGNIRQALRERNTNLARGWLHQARLLETLSREQRDLLHNLANDIQKAMYSELLKECA